MLKLPGNKRELAILGGPPAFPKALHVNRPNLGSQEIFENRLATMLESRQFTNNGPLVQELEERLAKYLGVKHCIATNNGTAALGLIGRALRLSGEVIVPSYTFVATAHSLLWQGLEPVFCDIDPLTLNLDPKRVEELITERTTGILAVHLWGRPCDISSLVDIANRHGLRLFFDAAHAFGCTHEGRRIAGFGDAEAFSFHATKVFHTFEGGAVTTDNDDLATQVKLLRNFGFASYDTTEGLGTNAKMSEAAAAMGLANLESIEGFFEENRWGLDLYAAGLGEVAGLTLMSHSGLEEHNCHHVVASLCEEQAGWSRDELIHILQAENILARRYFFPGCHRLEPYLSKGPNVDHRLGNTNLAASRTLVLPVSGGITSSEIEVVCHVIRTAVREAASIRQCLAERGAHDLG